MQRVGGLLLQPGVFHDEADDPAGQFILRGLRLAGPVPHKKHLEELGLPAGKADVGHAGGLVGRVSALLHLLLDPAVIFGVTGGKDIVLQGAHTAVIAENGLSGTPQRRGHGPGIHRLHPLLAQDLQRGGDDLLFGHLYFGRHSGLLSDSFCYISYVFV